MRADHFHLHLHLLLLAPAREDFINELNGAMTRSRSRLAHHVGTGYRFALPPWAELWYRSLERLEGRFTNSHEVLARCWLGAYAFEVFEDMHVVLDERAAIEHLETLVLEKGGFDSVDLFCSNEPMRLCGQLMSSYEGEHIFSELGWFPASKDTPTLLDMSSSIYALLGLEHHWTVVRRAVGEQSLKLLGNAWQTRRDALGEEHPDTLVSMSNLADEHMRLGDFERARELQAHVWEAREVVLGEDHPDTLSSMNNLANVLFRLGDFGNSLALHEKVWSKRKRILGKEHPDTLSSLDNNAAVLTSMGAFKQAIKHHRRVLETRMKVLGEEHPDTLASMNNLAIALFYDNQVRKARQLFERILEVRTSTLSAEDPDTLSSMANLASALGALGNHERARALYEEALIGRRHVLGDEHPDTLTLMGNFATTLSELGELELARELEEQALEVRLRVFGEEHPYTLTLMRNLAATLSELGESEQARELEDRALAAQNGAPVDAAEFSQSLQHDNDADMASTISLLKDEVLSHMGFNELARLYLELNPNGSRPGLNAERVEFVDALIDWVVDVPEVRSNRLASVLRAVETRHVS